MLELIEALLFSTLDFAPALVFASIGAVISERSGVVNLGIEGMMRVGAFAAAVAALVLPTGIAVFVGMAAGGLLGILHAYLCLRWKSDQIVSGMALNLVALALGTFLLESLFSPTGTPDIHQLHRWPLSGLRDIPILRALSNHSAFTYAALVMPWLVHWMMWKTPLGLRVRVLGDKPAAAATLGIAVNPLRLGCVVCSALLAGLGGAALSTSTLNRFENNMPAGLGFMALAAMVFGRWTPLGAFGAALFFAAGNALRIGLTSSAPWILEYVPQGVLLALPYGLALLVVSVQRTKNAAPAALGVPYSPEAR
jgi:general nucleoside transport system permease protein